MSIALAIFLAFLGVFALLGLSTWREERRARERHERHAEFDELEPEKMYDPDDYWELFK